VRACVTVSVLAGVGGACMCDGVSVGRCRQCVHVRVSVLAGVGGACMCDGVSVGRCRRCVHV